MASGDGRRPAKCQLIGVASGLSAMVGRPRMLYYYFMYDFVPRLHGTGAREWRVRRVPRRVLATRQHHESRHGVWVRKGVSRELPSLAGRHQIRLRSLHTTRFYLAASRRDRPSALLPGGSQRLTPDPTRSPDSSGSHQVPPDPTGSHQIPPDPSGSSPELDPIPTPFPPRPPPPPRLHPRPTPIYPHSQPHPSSCQESLALPTELSLLRDASRESLAAINEAFTDLCARPWPRVQYSRAPVLRGQRCTAPTCKSISAVHNPTPMLRGQLCSAPTCKSISAKSRATSYTGARCLQGSVRRLISCRL